MLRCRPAKTYRIPLRSDFPAGTTFPRRDYPSAGGIPGAAALAGTSPDRGKRIRKTTKRNGRNGKPRRGAGPRSTAAPDAKETRRQSSRASETSAHASATRRYGKTIKKKGRERPDIPYPVGLASLHAESVLTSKPPLRSYATVSGDDLRDKLLKFSSRYKTHNRKIPCICGTIPFRGVDRQ